MYLHHLFGTHTAPIERIVTCTYIYTRRDTAGDDVSRTPRAWTTIRPRTFRTIRRHRDQSRMAHRGLFIYMSIYITHFWDPLLAPRALNFYTRHAAHLLCRARATATPYISTVRLKDHIYIHLLNHALDWQKKIVYIQHIFAHKFSHLLGKTARAHQRSRRARIICVACCVPKRWRRY